MSPVISEYARWRGGDIMGIFLATVIFFFWVIQKNLRPSTCLPTLKKAAGEELLSFKVVNSGKREWQKQLKPFGCWYLLGHEEYEVSSEKKKKVNVFPFSVGRQYLYLCVHTHNIHSKFKNSLNAKIFLRNWEKRNSGKLSKKGHIQFYFEICVLCSVG